MITEQHISQVSVHTFVAEASELRLRPGQWPSRLATTMGNGQDFMFQRIDPDSAAHYQQGMGCLKLIVIND